MKKRIAKRYIGKLSGHKVYVGELPRKPKAPKISSWTILAWSYIAFMVGWVLGMAALTILTY